MESMSAFDTRLNVVAVQAQGLATDSEAPESFTAVEIALVNAMMIPGPEGAVPFPIGQYKFGISAETATNLVAELQAVLESLVPPKPRSNITIATDLEEAKKAADHAQKLRA